MDKEIKIFDNRPSDRAIGVVYENDAIVNISFMQGAFDQDTIKSLVDSLMEETNVHLLEIFKRLVRQKPFLSLTDALDDTCELYVVAFILQELD